MDLKAGYISLVDLTEVELWQRTFRKVGDLFPHLDEKRQTRQTISYLIGDLIHDLVSTTLANIETQGITSLAEVRSQPRNLVSFSSEMLELNRQLKKFLYRRLYRHSKVERMRVESGTLSDPVV